MSDYIVDNLPDDTSNTVPTDSIAFRLPTAVSVTPVVDASYPTDITTSDTSTQEHKEISQLDDAVYTPQAVKVRRYQLYKSRNEL